MKNRLEVIANISVIVAVVVFLGFIGRQEYERRHPAAGPAETAQVGKTIALPGVHFSPQGKTLILAISTQCHFCRDSEPFYKELAARSQGRFKLIAVLPQPLDEAQSYVQQSIAPSVEVVSSQLDSIGIRGTPTLLLVDGSGKVKQSWVGKLDDRGQQQVQSLL
jgi:hypothetical protein